MAKKPVRRKISAAASSSKTGKVSRAVPSRTRAKTTSRKIVPQKKKSVKAKSSKKISYKQEYINLLKQTNKILTKEVRAIHKAIVPERKKIVLPDDYEAFPKEEAPVQPSQSRSYRSRTTAPQSIEDEILGKLTDIEMEIRARDSVFDDLVHGSPKLAGGLNG